MKETAKNRILSRIYGRGKGWVFSAVDFLPDLKRWEIDRSLTDLAKEGKIARILPGLYYYPSYSALLQEIVGPDIQRVAYALARKYNWTIFPEGNTALNYLNLSTQVPARYIFISSGSSRKYKIGNTALEFRHRMLRESVIGNEQANLVIQALKSLGKIHASEPDFIKTLAKRFTADEWVKIEKASHKVAGWVVDIIRKAKEIANG
ncbi:hypothetical protein FACS18945_2500 [Bacteroidia bacterium]|nr:hypothetical protein FACS18945_2500 [Bacteroidia bacterium]